MSQLPQIELMHSEYGTAITINQKIVGWVNTTLNGKSIISIKNTKKVVDTGTQDSYIDHIKQMIDGEHYE